MNKEYSVDDLIRYLEPIPDDLWCVGILKDGHGRHCAIGLCYKLTRNAALALSQLCIDNYGDCAAKINDDKSASFHQPTPKLRILAALYEIKSKQPPTPPALVLAPATWPMVAMQVKPVEVPA